MWWTPLPYATVTLILDLQCWNTHLSHILSYLYEVISKSSIILANVFVKHYAPNRMPVAKAGNTLEGDVSDVIALDQPTSLFSPSKATRMSPYFSAKYGFEYTFQYTHVSSAEVNSTRYPSGLHKKLIGGRGPVWEGSWWFPVKN